LLSPQHPPTQKRCPQRFDNQLILRQQFTTNFKKSTYHTAHPAGFSGSPVTTGFSTWITQNRPAAEGLAAHPQPMPQWRKACREGFSAHPQPNKPHCTLSLKVVVSHHLHASPSPGPLESTLEQSLFPVPLEPADLPKITLTGTWFRRVVITIQHPPSSARWTQSK
jgi:hypothetical protein